MRKLLYIIFIFIIASCSSKLRPTELSEAERIMDSIPDSAFNLLSNSKSHLSDYSKGDRMKFFLLFAEAMNKAFIPMDTVKFMDGVLDYYKSHGKPYDEMQAYYMMGCVFRDRGDYPNANQQYYEAVKVAENEEGFEIKSLASRIYAQMALVFHAQRFPQKEIQMWRISQKLSIETKDTMSAIQCTERIGGAYQISSQPDSAYFFFRKAMKDYLSCGKRKYAASMQINLANYYLNHDDFSEMKSSLDEYRSHSGLFDAQGNIQVGYEIYYYYLGEYYNKVHNVDSAVICFRKLLAGHRYIQDYENAYKGLMSAYNISKQPDSVYKYSRLYADANDSANLIHSANEIIRMQSMYNYSETQKKNLTYAKKVDNLKLMILAIILIVITLSIIVLKFLSRRKKRSIELRNNYLSCLSKLEKAKMELADVKENADKFERDKLLEIENLERTLSAYESNYNVEDWKEEQALFENDIVVSMHKKANIGHPLNGSELRDLEGSLEKLLPDFYKAISNKRGLLSDVEFQVCLLTRIQFKPSEISNLLNLSQQRVTNIRSNINKKLFGQNGTKGLANNLCSLR